MSFDETLLDRGELVLLCRHGSVTWSRLRDPLTHTTWLVQSTPWAASASREFENAHRLSGKLDPAWARCSSVLVRRAEGPILVYKDEQATPVAAPGDVLSVSDFLTAAIGAASALMQTHSRNILHRDIRPTSLILDQLGTIRLSGFGRGIDCDVPDAGWLDLPVNDDALPYAAPEAARRAQPFCDQKSDLYALGIVFYEWLTGRPPFAAHNAAQWLHAHIAMEPLLPTALYEIPDLLANLVLKLIAKDPADRYRSAAALKADLIRCYEDWSAARAITPFVLDRLAPRLILHGLFGRQAETHALIDTAKRVSETGRSEVVLISGPAGAGKSVLATVLSDMAETGSVRFVNGKCDQHQREIPYGCVVQAFQSVINQLLSGSSAALNAGRERLLDRLGSQGQLIADLVPDFDLVIGSWPAVVELPAEAAQSRLNAAILQTLEAFAPPSKVLILFLDDLQWADEPTLTMLKAFALRAPPNILLLGALRDDEAICAAAIDSVRIAAGVGGLTVSDIRLDQLWAGEVTSLIAAALNSDPLTVESLAEVIYQRTKGNAFFVSHLLRTLVDKDLLHYDRKQGRWIWDLQKIEGAGADRSVTDLLFHRLDRLLPGERDVLRSLACIGPHCDEALLACILDITPDELATRTLPMVDAGLLSRNGETYAFSHDRVRDAAYALTSAAERPGFHTRVATIMISFWHDNLDESAFEIASQIRRAAVDDLDEAVARSFVSSLITAAHRAKTAAAVDQALGYLAVARQILGPHAWSAHYALAYQASVTLCDSLIIQTNMDRASEEIDDLLSHASTAMDKAAGYRLRATLQTLRSDYQGAISAGLSGLALLGVTLDVSPSDEYLADFYERICTNLLQRPIASFADLPRNDDPKIDAAMALLTTLVGSFFINDGMSFLHVAKIVELTLQYGLTPASPYGLSWFGVNIAHRFSAYHDAFEYGQVALAVIERYGWEPARPAALVAMDQISPWTQSLAYALARAVEGAAAGYSGGDLGMACYAWNHILSDRLMMGEHLSSILEEAEHGLALTRQIAYTDIERLINAQVAYATTMQTGKPVPAGHKALSTADFNELGATTVSRATLFFEWLYAGMTAFFFDHIEQASLLFEFVGELTWAVPAHIGLVDYHLFAALTIASTRDALRDGPGTADRLVPHRNCVAAWAALNPHTFLNKLLLIEAEMARLRGDALGAIQLYERSAAAASASGFIHEQALVNERAGAHCNALGLETAALQHLRAASRCYREWGAQAKVRQLEVEHPSLANGRLQDVGASNNQAVLDLGVWAEAAQTFANEIMLDRLIEKLMTSILVHAGAQQGLLLLMRGEEPVIEASARVAGGEIVVKITTKAPAPDLMLMSILNRVVRTKTAVVIHDARAELASATMSPRSAHRARSVICLPLIKQDKLSGMLYLENNLTPGVFTPGRTAMLKLLAQQVAISLETARVYADFVEENNRRRATEKALHSARADLARTAQLTEMGILAASIAHEINQPLTSIKSNAAAGGRWLNREEPDLGEALANLDAIERNAERAAEIVRALRALAKQIPVVLTVVQIDDLIREVLTLVSAETELQNVVVRATLKAGVGAILADRTQIQQVVLNLISNAMEAMVMTDAAARELILSSTVDKAWVVVSVQDTGEGIGPEQVGRIFDPFFTTKEKGMGMGLAICRSIMEAHGGSLDLLPSSTGGSVFAFKLPAVSGA